MPDPEALARAATHVGAGSIEVSEAGVGLVAGASLDLGGIAKGAALETLRARLHAARVHAALLSFGQSSVVALGAPREARGWRLALRAPDGGVLGFVTLRDRALSVSASRSQYSEIEGQRFGHVLDPRTGLALRVDRQAVVLAEDATQAEILSTALVVLSPEEGIALLARCPGCEGLIVEAGQKPWESEGFRAAGAYQPAPGP